MLDSGEQWNLKPWQKIPLRSEKVMIQCAKNESKIDVSSFFSEPSIAESKKEFSPIEHFRRSKNFLESLFSNKIVLLSILLLQLDIIWIVHLVMSSLRQCPLDAFPGGLCYKRRILDNN